MLARKIFVESLENVNLGQSIECLNHLGKKINSSFDDEGNTPLHLAVKYNSYYLINIIFEKMIEQKIVFSLEKMPKNKLGHTALQEAIMFAHPTIQYRFAPYLLKADYPEIYSYVTKEINKHHNQPSLANLYSDSFIDYKKRKLLKKILNTAPLFLNNSNDNGDNLLVLTLEKSISLFKSVLNSPYLNPKLINKLYPDFKNLNCTLYAAYSGNFKALKLLLTHDKFADESINFRDDTGQSLLVHVLMGLKDFKLKMKLVKILVDKGIEINTSTANNIPASIILNYVLSTNYSKEHFPIVDYLIKHGGKFLIEENYEFANKIFTTTFYNKRDELREILNKGLLKCDDYDSFEGGIAMLNQAMLIALTNRNFSLINEIELVLNKIYSHNPEQLNCINNDLFMIERNIELKSEFVGQPKYEIKAQLLNEIANIFIDKNIYMQALKILEGFLQISLPEDKTSKLKKLQFTSLDHMGYSIPFEETTGNDIKINNEFTKVIYAILQKHGFNANKLFYFAGFVPEQKANKIAIKSLFQESIKNTSILHGIKSHILQIVIICILIDLKLIKTKHKFSGQDIVDIIIKENAKFESSIRYNSNEFAFNKGTLWQYMFDMYSWHYSNENNIIFSPHILNMNLMNEVEELPVISTLMKRTLIHKLQILCDIVNSRGYDEKITPQQAIYTMNASENNFGKCDFGITFKELDNYYKQKQVTILNDGNEINLKGVNGQYTIITKKLKNFAEDIIQRRELYENMLEEQGNQMSLSC